MNSNFNILAIAVFLMVGFGAKAIPTPEAVEPAFDKDDNLSLIHI